MALTQGVGHDNINKLRPSDIVDHFVTAVINTITTNMYSSENLPKTPSGDLCVPSEYIASKFEISNPIIGSTNMIAKADASAGGNAAEHAETSVIDIYMSLYKLTNFLLRCGTFSYYKARRCDNGRYDSEVKVSGKVWFTKEYAMAAQRYTDDIDHTADFAKNVINHSTDIPRNNVETNMPFTAVSIKNLCAACLTAWQNSGRPVYTYEYIYCHSSCHSSCHSACHHNCNVTDCHDNCHMNGTCHILCYSNSGLLHGPDQGQYDLGWTCNLDDIGPDICHTSDDPRNWA